MTQLDNVVGGYHRIQWFFSEDKPAGWVDV